MGPKHPAISCFWFCYMLKAWQCASTTSLIAQVCKIHCKADSAILQSIQYIIHWQWILLFHNFIIYVNFYYYSKCMQLFVTDEDPRGRNISLKSDFATWLLNKVSVQHAHIAATDYIYSACHWSWVDMPLSAFTTNWSRNTFTLSKPLISSSLLVLSWKTQSIPLITQCVA